MAFVAACGDETVSDVDRLPVIGALSASSSTVLFGATVQLRWRVSDAGAVEIESSIDGTPRHRARCSPAP